MGRDLYLSDERYLAVLKRQRARIASGLSLNAVDSTTPGDKYTYASWGPCSNEAEAWPDPADRLFPDDPNRTTPKYRNAPHKCPFDGRAGDQGGSGCFFKCRIFSGRKARPARHVAVSLYDEAIAKAEGRSLSADLCPRCGGAHRDRHNGACSGPPTPTARPPHKMQG